MTNLTNHGSEVLGNIKVMLKGVANTQQLHTQKFDIHTDLLQALKDRMEQQEKLTGQIIDILISMNAVLIQLSTDVGEVKKDIAELKT